MTGGRRAASWRLGLAFATLVLAACGSGTPASPGTAASTPGQPAGTAPLAGTLTVSAAASLTDAFEELAATLTAEHPGVEVELNLDSSSTLASQIVDGAPADVFASADEATMARVVDAGAAAAEPAVFATNELVIVTKPGNPAGITGLAGLRSVDGVIALCGEEAPCGRYTAEALARADVAIPEDRVTRSQNVSATLAAVADGDAVAGVVYASDAVRAGDRVDALPVPPEYDVVARYPVVALRAATDRAVADAFVDLVLGPRGRAVLEQHGFGPPP